MNLENKIYFLTIFFALVSLAIIVYFFDEVSVKPDTEINVSEVTYSYRNVMKDLSGLNPRYISELYQDVDWDFVNLEANNYQIVPFKDRMFNYLGLSNYPIKGDSIYSAFEFKNLDREERMRYCVETRLIDNVGYVLGDGKIPNKPDHQRHYLLLDIPTEVIETIYIKVNSIDEMNNGEYHLFLLFYETKENSKCGTSGGEIGELKFYLTNTFEINKPFSKSEKLFKATVFGVILLIIAVVYEKVPFYVTKITRLIKSEGFKKTWIHIKTNEKSQVTLISLLVVILATFLLFSSL